MPRCASWCEVDADQRIGSKSVRVQFEAVRVDEVARVVDGGEPIRPRADRAKNESAAAGCAKQEVSPLVAERP